MGTDTPVELRELTVEDCAVSVGDEIRRARDRMQMTQSELADLVGVAVSTVSHWERGVTAPRGRLDIVRQVLNMDPTQSSFDETGGVLLQDATPTEFAAELLRRLGAGERAERAIYQRISEMPDDFRDRRKIELGPTADSDDATGRTEA